MQFRMVDMGYEKSRRYPYTHRIELLDYSLSERERLSDWIRDMNISCVVAGWNTGSVIYMTREDACTFILAWS